ncbi:MAG: hypothetical protein N4A53_02000 [Pelagimonas sp.]|jgi:hypothetical protein|nr:hypothetical protein [Pelagimonas sp.]
MNRSDLMSYATSQASLHALWRDTLAQPRYGEPGRLLRHGFKAYSQNDEDGILQEIFQRIGTTSRRFVEFGVGNGLECNSLFLLMQGWQGGWMEARKDHISAIAQSHQTYLAAGQLQLLNTLVTPDTIDSLLDQLAPDRDLDLLSIDVDFHDYWIWKAVQAHRPRVVMIEYNASWPPPVSVTVPYVPGVKWSGSNYFGASLEALAKLGRDKGYLLVGCCFAGVNAFFVRQDLCADHFHAPGDAAAHYEPARYFMGLMSAGHPAGTGPLVTV